jgi:ElaB/YqjD/DUF883 family membrane-anchored ribosome-binding protein
VWHGVEKTYVLVKPSVNACHAIMLLQELAAAEAALSAARRKGQDALVAAQEQYEAELLLHQQKLRDAKGAVRQREQDLQQRVTELEVGALPWTSPLSLSSVSQPSICCSGCLCGS